MIAHEIGHVAHRDGSAGWRAAACRSFRYVLGDFVGGGAVVFAAKTCESSYSREAEAAWDAYGADLMNKAGGDDALASMLERSAALPNPA